MIDVQAMFPVMVVNDLELLKQFYEKVFGFSTVFYEAGFYLHLIAPDRDVQLGFLVTNHPSQPDFLHARMAVEGYVISLEVADAKNAYQQAKDLGLDVAMPLKTETWGQTHFIVQDPAGIYIDIVEHAEAKD